MMPGVRFGRTITLACALLALTLAFPAASIAAPPAAALGPEIAVGTPSGGFVGKLALTPSRGPVGTPIAVSGQGLPVTGWSGS